MACVASASSAVAGAMSAARRSSSRSAVAGGGVTAQGGSSSAAAAAVGGGVVGGCAQRVSMPRRRSSGVVCTAALTSGGAQGGVQPTVARRGAPPDPPVQVVVQDATTGEQMDLTTALMKNRIIFLGERIDENTALRVCAELLALQFEDPRADIKIFLNCIAGTQYCVTTILDMIQYISCDVSVVAMGCVAGPPALLLAGATKGKRFALPSARIILSQPLGGLAGDSFAVRIQAKELSRNARSQVAFFAQFTGKTFDDMGEYLVRDTYMSAAEAVEVGIIDAVVPSLKLMEA